MATFRKDVSVLLISGNEERYFPELKAFADHLIADARIHPSYLEYLSGRMHTNDPLMDQVDDFVHRVRERQKLQNLDHHFVLVYHGHGLPAGFCPDGAPTPYQGLADIIGFDVPFLFINSCCYAGEAIEVFRDNKLLPHRGSVIASSHSYKPSYGTLFLDELLDAYRNKQPFRRRKISFLGQADESIQLPETKKEELKRYVQHPTRAGLGLDHLLYSQ